MCLSIAVYRPNDVLAKGKHAGHEWQVIHNGLGYRCGYVKVLPGHPWYGMDTNDLDMEASVHGGVTFAERDTHCGAGGPDNGWWLGFDCGHSGDAPDPDLRRDHPSGRLSAFPGEVIRTQEYVEAECRSLCGQAARAIPVKTG